MKLAMTAATLILVAGGAVACGGDDGDSGGGSAGSDSSSAGEGGGTSVDDFCGAFEDFATSIGGANEDDPVADVIALLKDEAEKLDEVGTPDDIPEDAEEGLDLVLEAIGDLPDDGTLEDITNLENSFSEDEKAKADAFDAYLAETCPDLGGGGAETPDSTAPSVDPSPSEVETPSVDPS